MTRLFLCLALTGLIGTIVPAASARTVSERIETNAAYFNNAPKWLKRNRAEKTIRRIQRDLEWRTRRVNVNFHTTPESFTKAHNLGPFVSAVSVMSPKKQTIHLGPEVDNENFDQVFGHELVHIISYQKYKGAIPKWLEEGLANHLAKKKPVDYKWLSQFKLPKDVRKALTHPIGASRKDSLFKYKASQALAEMLSKKCDLTNLLRLSVERKMDNYIETYCEIKDLDAEFADWVKKKS